MTRRKKKETKKLTADLPVEVIRPVVEELYEPYRKQAVIAGGQRNSKNVKYPGIKPMADYYRVNGSTIQKILSGEKKGGVTIEICDLFTTHSHYDLNWLYDEAEEWAKENPDAQWPDAYYRNGRRRPRNHVKK